jgi:hypothetical protein
MERRTKPFVARGTLPIELGARVRFTVEIRKPKVVRIRKLVLYQFKIPADYDFGISWRGRSSPGLRGIAKIYRVKAP